MQLTIKKPHILFEEVGLLYSDLLFNLEPCLPRRSFSEGGNPACPIKCEADLIGVKFLVREQRSKFNRGTVNLSFIMATSGFGLARLIINFYHSSISEVNNCRFK